jgi:uncharacterized protein
MNKKWWLVITLGLLVLVLAVPALSGCSTPAAAQAGAATVQVSQQAQGIWVTGTGEVSITPDIATLNLGVQAQEAKVSPALSEASDAMAKVMKALTDAGIAQKDIQTGYFSINQRTRWDSDKQTDSVIGYQVTNMVTVTLRDTGKAGSIIDAVVQAGGDFIRVNGISFSVENPAKYYSEVRQKAMDTAKSKAEELAKLAGVTLGKPTYVAENAQYTPNYGTSYANFSYSAGGAVPAPVLATPSISSGETKITLSVQVSYSVTP